MKFDLFLSICQTEVDGYMPSEKVMLHNFFDQVGFADELGFATAWVAETHLSTETQKQTRQPVIPHFKGEIGLNTDILQLAHKIFARTQRIHVGSAIRNILCNGGAIAHAEAIKTFLALHSLEETESRRLNIGFASGRFEFSNRPYGIRPRNAWEEAAWPVVKNKILHEAVEIFLRLLKSEELSSEDVAAQSLKVADFRKSEDWEKAWAAYQREGGEFSAKNPAGASSAAGELIPLAPRWEFEKLGVIPKEVPLDLLDLTLGSHDPALQMAANQHLPVAVFNLSITPPQVIEETHERMRSHYHPKGGPWQRSHMPRTAMIFLESSVDKARRAAERAWENYWKAMEGTLDPQKVEQAVGNSLYGDVAMVTEQIQQKYHPEDRLMLWFDFNNHDNEAIKWSMREFMDKVAPQLGEGF